MSYFLPYQARWIRDNSPLKLYEKTRRGGITYATSYRSSDKCLREKKGSSFTQWVSSRDELTAKEFITDYVAMWAREANKIAREMAQGFEGVIGLDGDNFEVVDEKHGITARVVRFKNGSRIVSLSSNPMAFAGKGGDVLIDEWDLHEDQAAIYDMAYPCITWGGQLELVSAYSATGTEDTEFAKLCNDVKEGNRPNISFHRTTIMDAIEDGFVEKVNEAKAKRNIKPQTREEFLAALKDGCRTHDAFNTQYMCVPNKASGTSLISKPDLAASKSAFDILRLHLEGDGGQLDVTDPCCKPYIDVNFWRDVFGDGGRLAFGWDIAVTGDLASIFVNKIIEEKRKKLLTNITFKRCKLESQRQIAESMFDAALSMVGCGDKSGVGYSDCVKLELKYAERFVGIVFGGTTKLVVMTTMQGAFERHLQMLPLNCPEIAADIAAIKTGKTPNNHLTFIHGTNDYLPDSHCDIAVSCALANYAGETIDNAGPCVMEPANYGNDSVSRRDQDWNSPDFDYERKTSQEWSF